MSKNGPKAPTRAELKSAASAAGAEKPGDYFVCNNMLFTPMEGGDYSRVSDGDLDISKIVEALESRKRPAEKLAAIVAVAAEAARDKWGAGGEFKQFDLVVLGTGDRSRVLPLGHGKYPYSRGDNNSYVQLGTAENPEYEGFGGHRFPWHIEITESNYMKSSELSGDEVRPACTVNIYVTIAVQKRGLEVAGREPEYGVRRKLLFSLGSRTAEFALQKLPMLLIQLGEHPVQLWRGGVDEFPELIGRKIFYRDEPATVVRYLADQGAMVIESEGGKPFKRPPWRDEDDHEDESTVKVDFLDPSIWWFRE